MFEKPALDAIVVGTDSVVRGTIKPVVRFAKVVASRLAWVLGRVVLGRVVLDRVVVSIAVVVSCKENFKSF